MLILIPSWFVSHDLRPYFPLMCSWNPHWLMSLGLAMDLRGSGRLSVSPRDFRLQRYKPLRKRYDWIPFEPLFQLMRTNLLLKQVRHNSIIIVVGYLIPAKIGGMRSTLRGSLANSWAFPGAILSYAVVIRIQLLQWAASAPCRVIEPRPCHHNAWGLCRSWSSKLQIQSIRVKMLVEIRLLRGCDHDSTETRE